MDYVIVLASLPIVLLPLNFFRCLVEDLGCCDCGESGSDIMEQAQFVADGMSNVMSRISVVLGIPVLLVSWLAWLPLGVLIACCAPQHLKSDVIKLPVLVCQESPVVRF